MKKVISLLCILTLLTGLVGCATSGDNGVTQTDADNEAAAEDEAVADNEDAIVEVAHEITYKITDTGQNISYDNEGNIIDPIEGQEYYGQDAQYEGIEPSFTDNGDGTITDNVTGLTWQQIPISETMTWEEAVAYCEDLEFAGYDDWRIPTAKELFGISDFEEGWPFIDTDYFGFAEATDTMMPSGVQGEGGPQGNGDSTEDSDQVEGVVSGEEMPPPPQGGTGEEMPPMPQGGTGEDMPPMPQDGTGEEMPPRPQGGTGEEMPQPPQAGIEETDSSTQASGEEMPPPPESGDGDSDSISKAQGQFWSSNFYYVGTTHDGAPTAFGVNHASGHIKGYPSVGMGKYVRAVRGDVATVNDFVDNSDGTITDDATGLMWMQDDNGVGLEWDAALAYAEDFEYAGYDDWRLPDIKELQSIVDYTGSYPAIDQSFFNITELDENINYYFWSNTSAYFSTQSPGNGYAWYVAFGKAVGNDGEDSHGAGAVRFSPKYTESSYSGEGGDNILNSVRLVRNIAQ